MGEADAWAEPLGSFKRVNLSGEIYWRSVPGSFTNTALEWAPSFLDGNRYNPKGDFAALYFAGCRELAGKEAEAKAKVEFLEDREILRFKIRINGLVDLTDDKSVSERLKLTKEDLVRPPGPTGAGYATTQRIGRIAYHLGIPGLRVPTSKRNDSKPEDWHNLVLFPSKLLVSFIIPA